MGARQILIFSESLDGAAELVTAGRALGRSNGTRLIAVAIGSGANALAEGCIERGADEALAIPVTGDMRLEAETVVLGLHDAVRATDPDTILISATRMGNDIMARLAQALEVPCASNCMALRRNQDGALEIERRVYGGRFTATQILAGKPQIASVPPNRFPKADPTQNARGSLRELSVALPQSRIKIIASSPRARSAVDVSKAEVIIAAGRGVKKAEDLVLLDALARLLGGVLAGSRPLTGDVDWLPTDRRIGLSGQTVKPNLYVACGISGQIEHVVGMKGARTVVAINNDAKAPIHQESDYSVISDLYEIVPALIAALETSRRV